MRIDAEISAPEGYQVRLETEGNTVTIRALMVSGWVDGFHLCGWAYHTDCPYCGPFTEEKLAARIAARQA